MFDRSTVDRMIGSVVVVVDVVTDTGVVVFVVVVVVVVRISVVRTDVGGAAAFVHLEVWSGMHRTHLSRTVCHTVLSDMALCCC